MRHFFFFIGFCFFFIKNSPAQDTIKVNNIEEIIEQEDAYAKKIEALKVLAQNQTEQNLSSSKTTYTKIFDLAKGENDSVTMSKSLVELMWRSISLYQADEALGYASEMELLFKERNETNNFYLAKAKSTKGYAFIILGELDKALENSLTANELFNNIKDIGSSEIKRDLINNHLTIAKVYRYIEDYDSAMKSVNIALELSEGNTELEELLGKSYNIKGDILRTKGELEESLDYYQKGLNFYTNTKDSINVSKSLKRIGSFYLKSKEFEKSKDYFKKALVICKSKERLDLISYLHTALGYTYRKLDQNELALKYIDSALTISKNFELAYMQVDALYHKARIHEEEKNYNQGIQTLNDALLLFDSSKDYQGTAIEIHKLLANFYKEKNELQKSITSFEKYIVTKEALIAKKAEAKTKILEVEYDYRNIKAKLEKKEIALQLSEVEQKRFKANTYFLVISIIFLFSFIVFMVLKQRKQAKTERLVSESNQELLQVRKEALDREVEFKSKSLTDFALQINEKNELLEKIKKQLKEIKPSNNYSKDVLLDTILFINDDINQNKEKIQLYSKVNENNDDFESKINERFDDLTDKERKVATMVRIGKTSKQIAIQLNISVASVDNYRYTVRKKMKVPKGESLGTFIKNI